MISAGTIPVLLGILTLVAMLSAGGVLVSRGSVSATLTLMQRAAEASEKLLAAETKAKDLALAEAARLGRERDAATDRSRELERSAGDWQLERDRLQRRIRDLEDDLARCRGQRP